MSYQELAARTLNTEVNISPEEQMLTNATLGLVGEAGEVAEMMKKAIFHRHLLDKDALTKELGDVLWYIAAICTLTGLDMEEVMAKNIEKLKARYPEGFDLEKTHHNG